MEEAISVKYTYIDIVYTYDHKGHKHLTDAIDIYCELMDLHTTKR